MLIEATRLKKSTVRTTQGVGVGSVDHLVFSATEARLIGFQLAASGVLKRFVGLHFDDVLSLGHETVSIDSAAVLEKKLVALDEVYRSAGSVLQVKAKTASGQTLGIVSDVLIDSETGGIVRFYLRNFLTERIIPLHFLVSISPKAIVFKDIVNEPTFDQLALGAEAAS